MKDVNTETGVLIAGLLSNKEYSKGVEEREKKTEKNSMKSSLCMCGGCDLTVKNLTRYKV